MELCLQSNPYSSKALFCPFSQSFTFRYTETLDQKSNIVVPEDDHGLYTIDILDPSLFMKCIHLTELYHFHDMIDMLVGCGYKKGTTFLGYGYDFRQNNRIDKLMDGLKAKLETAYKASGGRKVNLISHSMGGIMILCFLSLHRDDFVKYVNKWTCLTCPFQGDLPVVISCASLALADAGIMRILSSNQLTGNLPSAP
ncbi:phospholipase A(1) LCAT3-like isoform X2 [Arachis ipaensis]|uniref:phospholipase A(1) LCAT3-like isoform X2 n=1 Tax=Arachis ipaensis TaxID=130454 RepID=UPI000A2B8E02|nr:phospholipase A(1) LCAT3-like isoform X2 [Arachis ipaensis]XP_025677332.1 phospholipase A(1) LCAT3 isoform X2 [Arachis hypogaea]